LRARVVSVNLNGPINVLHAVLTGMAKRESGRVVTIASDAGRVGSSGQAVYSACKGGVISLTKTLARELARRNILLNVVCPGPTDTAMLQDFLNQGPGGQKVYDAMKRAIPLKRLGQPEDIPGIVAFLASADASFITGQVISVSGGLTMHG
jgi:2-hydroxycyclohexanecarboxyl-CoA dehydrogenase